MHKPKMLAIGTATQDVFLVGGEIFKPVREEDGKDYQELPLGSKLGVEEVVFATGGNAMNAAITFARQGLHSEFMGILGTEPAGQTVLNNLDDEGVDTRHIVQDERFRTSYSTILLSPNGERTILNYHGTTLRDDGDPLDLQAAMHADWLYLSSIKSLPLLEKIVSMAVANGIQVALNPSMAELEHPAKLRTILEDVSVLLVNKDEMQLLVEGSTMEELVRHGSHLVRTVIVSDGPNGVMATDSQTIVTAGMYDDVPVKDRTGAGDAFGSGFVAMHAMGKTLEESIVFASANATSVVSKIGATAGILHQGAKLHDMPIESKAF